MIIAGLEPTSFFVGLLVGAIVSFVGCMAAVVNVANKKK